MKPWQRSLIWEGLPLWLPLFVFGLIASVNWEYEGIFFVPRRDASTWSEIHVGLLMLAPALGLSLVGSFVLLCVRLFFPRITTSSFCLIPLVTVAILFIFPSLFIIVLGPAGITMIEQTNAPKK